MVLLQITSGRGPVECCWVVARLAETIVADARSKGLNAEVIEEESGPEKGTLGKEFFEVVSDSDTPQEYKLTYQIEKFWQETIRFTLLVGGEQ